MAKLEICMKAGSPKVFFGGGFVEGIVVVTLSEPQETRCCVIDFEGTEQIKFTKNEPNGHMVVAGVPVPKFKQVTYKQSKMHVNTYQPLVNRVMWSKRSQGEVVTLPAGKHTFPFRFKVPVGSPPSATNLAGENACHIRYVLIARLHNDKTLSFNKDVTVNVTVGGHNFSEPRISRMLEDQTSTLWHRKKTFMFSDGELKLQATIRRQLVFVGDVISMQVWVHNQSNKTVQKLTVGLVQRSKVSAVGKEETGTHTTVLLRRLMPAAPGQERTLFDVKFKVPSLKYTSFETSLVESEAKLELTAHVKETFAGDLTIRLPIVVTQKGGVLAQRAAPKRAEDKALTAGPSATASTTGKGVKDKHGGVWEADVTLPNHGTLIYKNGDRWYGRVDGEGNKIDGKYEYKDQATSFVGTGGDGDIDTGGASGVENELTLGDAVELLKPLPDTVSPGLKELVVAFAKAAHFIDQEAVHRAATAVTVGKFVNWDDVIRQLVGVCDVTKDPKRAGVALLQFRQLEPALEAAMEAALLGSTPDVAKAEQFAMLLHENPAVVDCLRLWSNPRKLYSWCFAVLHALGVHNVLLSTPELSLEGILDSTKESKELESARVLETAATNVRASIARASMAMAAGSSSADASANAGAGGGSDGDGDVGEVDNDFETQTESQEVDASQNLQAAIMHVRASMAMTTPGGFVVDDGNDGDNDAASAGGNDSDHDGEQEISVGDETVEGKEENTEQALDSSVDNAPVETIDDDSGGEDDDGGDELEQQADPNITPDEEQTPVQSQDALSAHVLLVMLLFSEAARGQGTYAIAEAATARSFAEIRKYQASLGDDGKDNAVSIRLRIRALRLGHDLMSANQNLRTECIDQAATLCETLGDEAMLRTMRILVDANRLELCSRTDEKNKLTVQLATARLSELGIDSEAVDDDGVPLCVRNLGDADDLLKEEEEEQSWPPILRCGSAALALATRLVAAKISSKKLSVDVAARALVGILNGGMRLGSCALSVLLIRIVAAKVTRSTLANASMVAPLLMVNNRHGWLVQSLNLIAYGGFAGQLPEIVNASSQKTAWCSMKQAHGFAVIMREFHRVSEQCQTQTFFNGNLLIVATAMCNALRLCEQSLQVLRNQIKAQDSKSRQPGVVEAASRQNAIFADNALEASDAALIQVAEALRANKQMPVTVARNTRAVLMHLRHVRPKHYRTRELHYITLDSVQKRRIAQGNLVALPANVAHEVSILRGMATLHAGLDQRSEAVRFLQQAIELSDALVEEYPLQVPVMLAMKKVKVTPVAAGGGGGGGGGSTSAGAAPLAPTSSQAHMAQSGNQAAKEIIDLHTLRVCSLVALAEQYIELCKVQPTAGAGSGGSGRGGGRGAVEVNATSKQPSELKDMAVQLCQRAALEAPIVLGVSPDSNAPESLTDSESASPPHLESCKELYAVWAQALSIEGLLLRERTPVGSSTWSAEHLPTYERSRQLLTHALKLSLPTDKKRTERLHKQILSTESVLNCTFIPQIAAIEKQLTDHNVSSAREMIASMGMELDNKLKQMTTLTSWPKPTPKMPADNFGPNSMDTRHVRMLARVKEKLYGVTARALRVAGGDTAVGLHQQAVDAAKGALAIIPEGDNAGDVKQRKVRQDNITVYERALAAAKANAAMPNGLLWKKGEDFIGKYQQRRFVVTGGVLVWSKDGTGKESGRLPISELEKVEHVDVSVAGRAHALRLHLKNGKVRLLAADTQQEANTWVLKLTWLIEGKLT